MHNLLDLLRLGMAFSHFSYLFHFVIDCYYFRKLENSNTNAVLVYNHLQSIYETVELLAYYCYYYAKAEKGTKGAFVYYL